jgi:hypothetical protein
MTPEGLQWAIGLGVTVLLAVGLFTWNWVKETRARIDSVDERLTAKIGQVESLVHGIASHSADTYVKGHEIAEVKRAITELRQEVTSQVGDLRREVTDLLKVVSRMIGANK